MRRSVVRGVRPSAREAAIIRRTELLMGYGPRQRLVAIGAVAGLVVGLLPLVPLAINELIKYVSSRSTPYGTLGNTSIGIGSFIVGLLPELVMLTLYGALLSICVMISIQREKYVTLALTSGSIRFGLEDLVGLLVGTPMVWFFFQRHGAGLLFFLLGSYLLFVVTGWILASLWRMVYGSLVRWTIEVPLEREIEVTVRRTLHDTLHIAEVFRVEKVDFIPEDGSLEVKGQATEAFHREKGDQRVRRVIREIPLVTQNVKVIRLVTW